MQKFPSIIYVMTVTKAFRGFGTFWWYVRGFSGILEVLVGMLEVLVSFSWI
jgi:hypothetical protein